MRSTVTIVLIIWSLALHASSESLERFIAEAVAKDAPPSASVAIVYGTDLIFEKSFGFNDAEHRYATTPQSVYNLYSLSKIVTATVVMQLAEKGKVDLDAPLTRYFPRFKTYYEGTLRQITVKELLMHCSGVTDRSGDYRHLFDDGRYAMLLEQGATPPMKYDLAYEPGSEARYSSSEYIILGYLIEKVTGLTFEAAVTKMVLEPAGMTHAGFGDMDLAPGEEVFGTLRLFSWMGLAMRLMISDGDKDHYEGTTLWLHRINVRWSPAGGLKGSVHDMARFLQATHRLELYDEATYEQFLFTPPVDVDTTFSKFDRVRFGIGWYHLENGGDMFYQHQGIGPGFRNIMRMYPGYDLSFVILTNQTGTDIDAWADRLFEAIKDELE